MEDYAKNLLKLVRGEVSLEQHPELIEIIPLLGDRNRWRLQFALQDEFIRLFPLLEGPTSLEFDWLDYRVESVVSELVWVLGEQLNVLLVSEDVRALENRNSLTFAGPFG